MRKLLYIPIIHDQSDMGSFGPVLEKASSSYLGERRWARHKETVAAFWGAIGTYFATLDTEDIKIYQDGMAAEGELGRKVIEEAARRGSKNHQILLDLLDRGAEIRKTEDISLLLEERRLLLEATQTEPDTRSAQDSAQYGCLPQRLADQRDEFVAQMINETLGKGESGVLFMGASHDVLPHLAEDIQVTSLKERDKVLAYFQELTLGHDDPRYEELIQYLVSQV